MIPVAPPADLFGADTVSVNDDGDQSFRDLGFPAAELSTLKFQLSLLRTLIAAASKLNASSSRRAARSGAHGRRAGTR
jgi:hypothetical protein